MHLFLKDRRKILRPMGAYILAALTAGIILSASHYCLAGATLRPSLAITASYALFFSIIIGFVCLFPVLIGRHFWGAAYQKKYHKVLFGAGMGMLFGGMISVLFWAEPALLIGAYLCSYGIAGGFAAAMYVFIMGE